MDTCEDKARSKATFCYTVANFSKMKDPELSPSCYVYNLPWQIEVEPCYSKTQERKKYLSFFLVCNGESGSHFQRCYVVADFRLLSNQEGQEPFSIKLQHLFHSKESSWGYPYFMTWQDVLEVESGYIKDDSITLEVHIVAENYERRISRILEQTKGNISDVELSIRQLEQEVVEKIETFRGDIQKREERREATYEGRENRIFEETKQEMSRMELSMKQWQQEVVEKIEMLKGDTAEREEKKKVAFASLSEESKQDITRLESNIRQWQQEIVKKIEMLGADVSKETENRKFRETIIRKDKKEEKKKRQRQLEENRWKEMEERIESLKTGHNDMQMAVMKKNMIITGLGFLLLLIILNIISFLVFSKPLSISPTIDLDGSWYIRPRIA